MGKHSQLIDRSNGYPFYEVDPKYFDCIKHKEECARFDVECNILAFPTNYKRPHKVRPRTVNAPRKPVKDKNYIYNMQKKHSQGIPGPWQYNTYNKWLKHPQTREFSMGPDRNKKKLKYKWMQTPGEDGKQEAAGEDVLAPERKYKQGKIDMTATKNTLFDQINRDNTRQN